ncbi:MAG: hypothetical protein Kow0042_22070 [Calditrichia bacterium]
MKPVTVIFFVSFLLVLTLYCTNVTQLKLKENPEFEKNAVKFVVTNPINQVLFIIEDLTLNTVYEVAVDKQESQKDVTVLEEEQRDDAYISKTKTFASHKFFIVNPWDSVEYEIVGTTTYFITKEEEESKSFEVGKMVYPIEFWIFDNGIEVGKITIYESPSKPNQTLDLIIHDKQMKLDYSIFLNKKSFLIERCFAFEDENGLITLIGLKQKGTRHRGDILIQNEISRELKADILSMYMIIETALGIIGAEKI